MIIARYTEVLEGNFTDLAVAQGSEELVYTDVHGVYNVTHSQELFRALSTEIAVKPMDLAVDPFEGVDLLRTLIQTIIHGRSKEQVA
jgi:hypothetical protein